MSNPLAIAAVTATLQRMLNDGADGVAANLPPDVPPALNLNSVNITTRPPDRARTANDTGNQLNLFLYQVLPNAALRNMDMPRQVRSGETAQPPAALTLHYLLSAYGAGDDETAAHVLLGQAIRIFHDRAVLDPNDIRNAFSGNDLYAQVERVRITQLPLSVEDLSKLWTGFATNYRVSAGFEVSVVLIESQRGARTPLPVLTRGKDDSGVSAQADLVSPFPTLLEVRLPDERQPSIRLGEKLVLRGHHLSGSSLTARFNHPRFTVPIDIAVPAVTTDAETDVTVSLPDDAVARSTWLAGFYTVSLFVSRPADPSNKTRLTNELAFSLAPKLLTIAPLNTPAAAGFTLVLTASPLVLPEQRTSALFNGAEIKAQPRLAPADDLRFTIGADQAPSAADIFVRLRVEGVDSLIIDYTKTPPAFDAAQKVTLT